MSEKDPQDDEQPASEPSIEDIATNMSIVGLMAIFYTSAVAFAVIVFSIVWMYVMAIFRGNE